MTALALAAAGPDPAPDSGSGLLTVRETAARPSRPDTRATGPPPHSGAPPAPLDGAALAAGYAARTTVPGLAARHRVSNATTIRRLRATSDPYSS
jgi:hypothetical protein